MTSTSSSVIIPSITICLMLLSMSASVLILENRLCSSNPVFMYESCLSSSLSTNSLLLLLCLNSVLLAKVSYSTAILLISGRKTFPSCFFSFFVLGEIVPYSNFRESFLLPGSPSKTAPSSFICGRHSSIIYERMVAFPRRAMTKRLREARVKATYNKLRLSTQFCKCSVW